MTLSVRIGAAVALAMAVAGCASIKDHRGYVMDEALMQSIQPGIDNQQSVEGTLGHPTFASQFGQPTWYYISSTTYQKPFTTPKIKQHAVLAVRFDAGGKVISATHLGMEKVVHIRPNRDATPTLGRSRSFLQDLFGNIGQVGSFGNNAPTQGGGPNGS